MLYHKFISRLTTVFLIILTLNCKAEDSFDQKVQDYVNSRNEHALNLQKILNIQHGSYAYSPHASAELMAALLAGSNNETSQEIQKGMNFNESLEAVLDTADRYDREVMAHNNKKLGSRINNSCSIWAQDGFPIHPYYSVKLKKFFSGIDFTLIDFFEEPNASRKEINSWLRKKDRHYENDALKFDTINSEDRMIPLNNFLFEGQFKYPFVKSDTKPATFHIASNESIYTLMMQTHGEVNYYEDSRMKIIDLPYENEALYMTVVLPKDVDTYNAMEDMINLDILDLPKQSSAKVVDIKLPRINTTTMYDLTDILQGVGISKAFHPNDADFTNISVFKGLHIDWFIHRATINIDEHNRRLFGFHRSLVGKKGEPVAEFHANSPFKYYIRESKYGGIISMGRFSGFSSTHPQSSLADIDLERIMQYTAKNGRMVPGDTNN